MSPYSQSIRAWFLVMFVSLTSSIWQTARAQTLIPSVSQTADIVGDTVVNAILPTGFLLSGTVTTESGEPLGLGTITAQSPTGVYAGNVADQDFAPTYRVGLPAGTYSLSLSIPFLDSGAETPAFIYMTSAAATGLVIAADVTQNLVVPGLPPLVTATGLMLAQDAVPTTGALRFVSVDGSIFTIALFDEDEYVARLPVGTYEVWAELTFTEDASASGVVIMPGPLRASSRVVVHLGPVTLTGGSTFHDVELPVTGHLSGVVTDAFGAPVSPARVVASMAAAGVSGVVDTEFSCRPEVSFTHPPASDTTSTAIIYKETLQGESNPSGAYRMPLPLGTYHLGVTLGFELQPGLVPTPVTLDASRHVARLGLDTTALRRHHRICAPHCHR